MTGLGFKPPGAMDLVHFKAVIAQAGDALSMKELRGIALTGRRNIMRQVRTWGQGTPARRDIKQFVLADGRHIHPTKGIAKSDGGGYNRRSRRSNRS